MQQRMTAHPGHRHAGRTPPLLVEIESAGDWYGAGNDLESVVDALDEIIGG